MRTSPLIPLALVTAALAGGCAGRSPEPSVVLRPDERMVPATPVVDRPDPAASVVEVRVPVHPPQLRPLPGGAPAPSTRPADVLSAVVSALEAATVRPSPGDFVEAVQRYDYAPGLVYAVVGSPGYVTAVALRPGERLLTASAGDTSRWSVEAVEAGQGEGRRTLLLVKPRRPFAQTNLVVATDERVYQLELTSVDGGAYHSMVEWAYPFGDVLAARGRAEEAARREASTASAGLDLSRVNFDYLVLTQPKQPPPAWAPLRAFDDGRRTYVQFPPGLAASEAPPLFVLPAGKGERGEEAQLVNYRVRGGYYVVNRLFDRAELRAGQAPQQVVRIVRGEARGRR